MGSVTSHPFAIPSELHNWFVFFFSPARWYKVNPINWLLLLRYSAGARFAVPVLAEQISVFKIPRAIVGVTLCNLQAD